MVNSERRPVPYRLARALFSSHGLSNIIETDTARLCILGEKVGGLIGDGLSVALYSSGHPVLAAFAGIGGSVLLQDGVLRTILLNAAYSDPYLNQMGGDSGKENHTPMDSVGAFLHSFRGCMNAEVIAPHMFKEYVAELGSPESIIATTLRLAFHATSRDAQFSVSWWRFADAGELNKTFFFTETKELLSKIPSSVQRIGFFNELGVGIHSDGSVYCSVYQSITDAHKSLEDPTADLGEEFNIPSRQTIEDITAFLRYFRTKLFTCPIDIE